MITGASAADAALVLIDAVHGIQQQSRCHGFLLNLLGIRQIVVLVNKMDLIEYSRAANYEAIRDEYTRLSQEHRRRRAAASSRSRPATATI